MYIADYSNSRIHRVDPSGTILTVAGNGQQDATGDGGSEKLRALEKVIKRGGGMCILGIILEELIFPAEANAGEDEILENLFPQISLPPAGGTSFEPGLLGCEPEPSTCEQ